MKKSKLLIGLAAVAMLALTACQGSGGSTAETEAETKAAAESSENGGAENGSSENSGADSLGASEKEADENGEKTAAESGEEVVLKLAVPKAPPTLPLLHMADAGLLGDNVKMELDIWDAPEQLIAMVQDGEHDMFAFPLTVAAKLYNKGLPVRLTNVNTWGVTYFITTDPNLTEWSQLKGKTVYVPLQSSPPDALTQFFLNEAGLKAGEDVEIVYSTTAEISQMMAAGKIEYATLIEPQVTAAKMNNDQVRVAFSFEDEWKKVKGEDSIVPNAGLGTTETFISEKPELVTEFEAAYEESLNWVLEHPADAAALAEEKLGLKAALVEKAIPNMGLIYKNAADAKTDLDGFYQLLNDFDPSMIGGKVPDEGMYYSK